MKKLMLGNEALAQGLYESGVRVVCSYPGTPSTEITEFVSQYDEIYSEWAPNEKVAAEAAFGACAAGARSFCAQKHVGLNVCADLFFTASYTGVNGGMVLAVADDPGMHSSQNEQDSRHYAIAAKLPMLEPADSAECLAYTKQAYELSERFDTPVLIRLTTRVAHSQSIVETGERAGDELKPYEKNAKKFVMVPAHAKARHLVVEERSKNLTAYAETTPLNTVEMHDTKIGVIAAGITYQYAKEALGDQASYLKLGLINPLPVDLIKDFAAKVDTLYVMEELDPVIEDHCRRIGVSVIGKEAFTYVGEYTAAMIREKLLGQSRDCFHCDLTAPGRPPVLCPGCPHRGTFHVLSKMKLNVSGDIGCYSLGASAPLSAMDTTICMGASISALHGMTKARGTEFAQKSVAVIGDSTFMHSGMTGLCDIVYNKGIATVLILDNSITAMTGHQQNPTTGFTLKNEPTNAVDLAAVCRALGVKRVREVDPFDLSGLEAMLKEELAADEPSVIIVKRPCALLKGVKHNPPLKVASDQCRSCRKCMQIGCPAISFSTGKAVVDTTLCVGCGLCQQLCPFGAIQ